MTIAVRTLFVIVALVGAAPPSDAQVINGESTADSAYAKTPPAAWSPPSGQPEPAAVYPQDDRNDRNADGRRERN